MGWAINKDKAKERFLKIYRVERDKKFLELDIQFMKALETDNISDKNSVIEKKNTLREFPSTITNESFSTVDELRALWPTGSLDLPNRW